jgi:hypothetical protein
VGKRKAFQAVLDAVKEHRTLFAGAATAGALAPQDAEAGIVNIIDPITGLVRRGIEAYHGSPHKFDKFSMDNIGTGEGAQAYGHGLYFADSQDVAKGYRSELTGRDAQKSFQDGLPDDADFDDVNELMGTGHFSEQQERVLRALEDNDWLGFDYPSQAINAAYRDLRNYDPSPELVSAMKGEGALYRTEIDVDPDTLLDWDKPLSEQSESIKDVFLKAEEDEAASWIRWFDNNDDVKSTWDDLSPKVQNTLARYYEKEGMDVPSLLTGRSEHITGERIYNNLAERPEDAAKKLNEMGIPGIRYLDGDSRSAGQGSSNYVMFDDAPISIKERGNADPRLLAGAAGVTAGAMALGSQDAEAGAAGVSRKVYEAMVPKRYGDEAIEIIRNPLPSDYGRIKRDFMDAYPNAPRGEVAARHTIDEDGNRYIWPASDGTHYDIEPEISRQTGRSVDQNNTELFESGYATPAALAGTAAATGAGMAMYGNESQAFNSDSPNYQMPEYQQDNRLSDAVNRFSNFHQKRANKRGALDGMKQELQTLLQGVNTIANDVIFPAMDKPMQGYLGLGAAFSALAGGGSMEQAVGAGATAAQTPVDQTTYNMGGTVTDSLSPYVPAPVAAGAGALFNAGALMGAPL